MELARLSEGIGKPEQAGLAAAGLTSATVVASQILPHTVITALVLSHTYKVMTLSCMMALLSLASALRKAPQPPMPKQADSDRQPADSIASDDSHPNLPLVPVRERNPGPVEVSVIAPSGETRVQRFDWERFHRLLRKVHEQGLPQLPKGSEVRVHRVSDGRLLRRLLWTEALPQELDHSNPVLTLPKAPLCLPEIPIEYSAGPIKRRVLEAYLKKHGTELTVDQVVSYMKKGAKLYKRILAGKEVGHSKENVLSIVWHLVGCQIAKDGKPADEWLTKVEDREGKLTDFFLKVEGVHNRPSSHLKGVSDKQHRGIDLNPKLMPAGKGHLLVIPLLPEYYGRVRYLAVKPENYGIQTWSDFVGHTWEYLESLYRWWVSGNEQEGMRKERPLNALLPFGIKRICEHAEDPRVREIAPHLDHLKERDGNEVILKGDELFLSESQYPVTDPNVKLPEPDQLGLPPLKLGEWVPQLQLIKQTLSSLPDPVKQFELDLPRCDIAIGGERFTGKAASEFVNALQRKLDVDDRLAHRIFCLVTQGVMREIALSCTHAPFPDEIDDPDYLINRDESSTRVRQAGRMTFDVVRENDQIYIVAELAFDVIDKGSRTNGMLASLRMHPASGYSLSKIELVE